MSLPKITVITVCYNSSATILDTVRSVAAQTYPNVEYIIIDGKSTDGTLDCLKEYSSVIARIVSEPDRGIYDAMNKGLSLATGDVIGLINADDFYASPDVLAKMADVFSDQNADACYGDLCYVKQDDIHSIVRYWRSCEFVPGAFQAGWCPPHPTFFVRRKIYLRYGLFNLEYPLAADAELMMRLLAVHRIRVKYLPELLVKMRLGGATNRSMSNIIKQNIEILRAQRRHGLRPRPLQFLGGKLAARARQFLVHP